MIKIKLFLIIVVCMINISYGQNSDNGYSEYFRHLRYNHVSPYIPPAGIHPIDKATAENTSHYIFKYDSSKRLIEIINNHYHYEKQHPLATIGAYRVKVDYEDTKGIMTFFDINGNRMTNNRGVYKEVYHFNTEKRIIDKLYFFDLDDQPMESNWNIAEYHWYKKSRLIIENRYNLKGEKVPLSPYFNFGTTGILLNYKELPKAHYNLNSDLELVNNDQGIASYHDAYDDKENHISFTYKDALDNLTLNKSKFAVGKKVYDSIGNQTKILRYDTEGKETVNFSIPTSVNPELAKVASAKDSMEIRQKSLNYLDALHKAKPSLLEEAMNDSLTKITIGYNRKSKKEYARAITKDKLIENAKGWNKANNRVSKNPKSEIIILDIYNRIATVKLVSENWVEYLHFIKLDGKWSVVNLLWQYKNINRYPKN